MRPRAFLGPDYEHRLITSRTGDPANEVQYAYNDLGALEKEYQEHDGAKDGSTPYVQYDYMDSALAGVYTKAMRLKSVQYPSTRLVHYRYGDEGSTSEMISRLATIHADGTGEAAGLPGQTLASYTYNGLGRIATEEFPEPGVKLDYAGGSSGAYSGLDRFGRVKDQRWHASGTDKDRYAYGYDYASNRLWRENALTHASANKFDWAYTYDGLHRLADADRGTLDDPPSEGLLSGSDSRKQAWTLDLVGNWDTFKWDPDGQSGWTTQNRTHNKANEIDTITDGAAAWIDPEYDARGNTTKVPVPGDEVNHYYTLTYDAWNRLVKVQDDQGTPVTIAEYRYDGLNRRIRKYTDKVVNDWTVQEFYYNAGWQMLEVRKDIKSRASEPEVAPPPDARNRCHTPPANRPRFLLDARTGGVSNELLHVERFAWARRPKGAVSQIGWRAYPCAGSLCC